MNICTLSIIKNLRYTKLNDLYTYYYICLDESFMNLTEDTRDLENIDTYIKEIISEESLKLSIEQLSKYFEENDIDFKEISDDIILISIQNDPDEADINMFKEYLIFNGYYESCFKFKKLNA